MNREEYNFSLLLFKKSNQKLLSVTNSCEAILFTRILCAHSTKIATQLGIRMLYRTPEVDLRTQTGVTDKMHSS